MKKIILTLIISIIILGLASVLFSFEKKESRLDNEEVRSQSESSNPNLEAGPSRLPASQSAFLAASLNPNFIPIRNWAIKEPDIQAKAAGVFDPQGDKFLFQVNIKEKLPIASLTKIMTAIIVLENLNLDDVIVVSRKAVMTEGENGRLVIGEKLTVRNLLYVMLIKSSNDAAVALKDRINDFIALMNKKAKELGLENTHFVDSTGISKFNYSTIFDLAKIAKYSFDKPLIWQMLGIREIEVYSQDRKFKHYLVNTNKLLFESANLQTQIIGGKTGFTKEAGGCMLTIIKKPNKPGEYLIVIVLGANNRELETKKLIEWTEKAYLW